MAEFIYFFLGIILSVVISLATPYIQPRVNDLLEKFNIGNKRKRREALQRELARVTELHASSSKLTAVVMKDLTLMVSVFAFEVIFVATALVLQIQGHQMMDPIDFGISGGTLITNYRDKVMVELVTWNMAWIFVALGYLLLFLLITISSRIMNLVGKVISFEDYKRKAEEHIKRLAGNQSPSI